MKKMEVGNGVLTIIRWLAALSIFCLCGLFAFIICYYSIYLCEK